MVCWRCQQVQDGFLDRKKRWTRRKEKWKWAGEGTVLILLGLRNVLRDYIAHMSKGPNIQVYSGDLCSVHYTTCVLFIILNQKIYPPMWCTGLSSPRGIGRFQSLVVVGGLLWSSDGSIGNVITLDRTGSHSVFSSPNWTGGTEWEEDPTRYLHVRSIWGMADWWMMMRQRLIFPFSKRQQLEYCMYQARAMCVLKDLFK